MVSVLIECLLLSALGQSEPIRVSVGAMPDLIKRVEPAPEPRTLRDNVVAELLVGEDGHVLSVKIVKGHPLHVKPATDALEQWVFKPFLRNGKPVRGIASVSVLVPDAIPGLEKVEGEAAIAASSECRRLLSEGMATAAEEACRTAVSRADEHPGQSRLHRAHVRTDWAHALFLLKRYAEALEVYRAVLEITGPVRSEDSFDRAGELSNVGRTLLMLGRFREAEPIYERAVAAIEKAAIKDRELAVIHRPDHQALLMEFAHLKRGLGKNGEAAELEKRAAAIK